MRRIKSLSVCAASLMITAMVLAQAEPTTRPSSSSRWGFAPYNRLTSCTEEQKQKITEIHARANAEIRAIKEKEEADIMAVLTDEQKAELDKMESDRKAKAKEKRDERKKEKDEEKDK